MSHILWADPHFTDNELDDYRWDIFPHLTTQAIKHQVEWIVCLGDLVDRKDRHTGKLVNRLVDEFADLRHETKANLSILAGNHDKPVSGPYYWDFLNNVGVHYINKPIEGFGVLYLPFSSNAVEDWKEIDWNIYKAIFMHQTVEGAVVEDDRKIPSNPYPLPPLPDDIPIFSGDVHRPQKIGNLMYVGAPHPVRFSETWPNRIILIEDDKFTKPIDIWIPGTRRAIIDIESSSELTKLSYRIGDQIKIRYKLTADSLVSYPEEEIIIKEWARKNGIYIISIEPLLVGEGLQSQTISEPFIHTPESVMKLYSDQEKLEGEVVDMGYEILKESR